jgi:diadenosine tetraphosphate (Ap4A) HIT family hydrolase
MQNPIWQNRNLKIEIEESEVPWLKVFTKESYREMSDVPKEVRVEIYEILDLIEREMISYYKPTKINIASFGNYVPQVHWHIMARFAEDSYFPEPMWGIKQREGTMNLAYFDTFISTLKERLDMCI